MEGAAPPLKASFIPPTLTQLPLWCKNKRTNKNNHSKTNKKTHGLSGDGWGEKLGPLPISPGQEGEIHSWRGGSGRILP